MLKELPHHSIVVTLFGGQFAVSISASMSSTEKSAPFRIKLLISLLQQRKSRSTPSNIGTQITEKLKQWTIKSTILYRLYLISINLYMLLSKSTLCLTYFFRPIKQAYFFEKMNSYFKKTTKITVLCCYLNRCCVLPISSRNQIAVFFENLNFYFMKTVYALCLQIDQTQRYF